MSRIIRSSDHGAQALELEAKVQKAEPKSYAVPSFRTYLAPDVLKKVEAERLTQLAVAEVRVKALQEAEGKLKQPLRQGLENIEGVLDDLSQFRRELFKEVEVEVVELVRKIAKRVLLRELNTDPAVLTEIVKKSLEEVEKAKEILIVFSPEDEKVFQSAKPDFAEKLRGREDIQLLSDAQVPGGRALVKTQSKEIMISVEDMVDEILNRIREVNQNPKEPGDEGDKI